MIPASHISGGRQQLGALSKQGNRLLRMLLMEAAQSVVRLDAGFRKWYGPCDKPKGVARIARSAASVPISTDEPKSTSRTYSDNVRPARSARDSSTRSSASDNFVPTDFVRSSRFIAHRHR